MGPRFARSPYAFLSDPQSFRIYHVVCGRLCRCQWAGGKCQRLSSFAGCPATLVVNVNPATATPVTGQTNTPLVTAPYFPVMGRSVLLVLSGSWTGSVTVLRSTDQGSTKLPITIGGTPSAVFSSNCCEPIWDESEAAAQLYLNIALTSGTVNYRIAQ